MFFALRLIQSYGSGIRRAKKAMDDNRSPKLIFEPKEENEKDYTMVTAMINEEFAAIREEEKGKIKGNDAQEMPKKAQESPRETELPLEEKMIWAMKRNPGITRKQMSTELEVTEDMIKHRLSKLRKEGRIERIGSTKAGSWIVKE